MCALFSQKKFSNFLQKNVSLRKHDFSWVELDFRVLAPTSLLALYNHYIRGTNLAFEVSLSCFYDTNNFFSQHQLSIVLFYSILFYSIVSIHHAGLTYLLVRTIQLISCPPSLNSGEHSASVCCNTVPVGPTTLYVTVLSRICPNS